VLNNGQELAPDFPSAVARCFGNGGYRTVQIGKLHFQNHEDHDLDPRGQDAFGFDVFQLSEEPGCYEDAYRTWLRGEHPEWVETFTVPRPASPARHGESQNFRVLEAPWQYSHSGWVAEQAERYLYSWGKRPERQFLHLGFYAPHPPLNPTREMFAPYERAEIPPPIPPTQTRMPSVLEPAVLREYRRHFAAMVTGVDLAVGQLLERLEQEGELDDTLIIFSSDHGDLCGDHGGVSKGPSWYEGIMRLPLILHWPKGLGREGRVVDGLVEMVDLLPTLLGLCHLPVPPMISGRDWSASLEGDSPLVGREDLFAVADGSFMLRTRDHKYLRYLGREGVREVLYHLADDPDEIRDRAAEPGYREELNELRSRALTRWQNAARPVTPRRLRF